MVAATKGSLDALLSTAEKKFGMKVGSMNSISLDVKFISSGNINIDWLMGGGVPLGRTIELYGPPSSGKTTTALQTAANLQRIIKAGGDPERGINATDRILYLDYEQAMDERYAISLGLDTRDESTFIFAQPDTLEEGANFIEAAVKTGEVRLVIVDSVAAMTPSSVAEAEVGKSLPAVAAKLLKTFGQKMNPVLLQNNATIIYINHAMEAMAMGRPAHLGPLITTPGGVALKFFASVRVSYKQIGKQKATVTDPLTQQSVEQVVSTDVRVETVKNKIAPPYRKADVRVRFGRGFDNFWSALQILISHKQVMYSTGYYYFHKVEGLGLAPEWMARAKTGTNRPYIQSEPNVLEMAELHPEWRALMIAAAEHVMSDSEQEIEPLEGVNLVTGEVEDEGAFEDEIQDAVADASAGPTTKKQVAKLVS